MPHMTVEQLAEQKRRNAQAIASNLARAKRDGKI